MRKLKVGETVKVAATVFDSDAAIAGKEKRWSEEKYPLTWMTQQLEGKIVSFDKASKWWVQFEDAKSLVHRKNIVTTDATTRTRPSRSRIVRVEADNDADLGNLSDVSSSSEDEVGEPLDARVAELEWSAMEESPTFDQRRQKGFTIDEKPEFRPRFVDSRSGPTLFQVWLTWTSHEFMQKMVDYMDEQGRMKYAARWQTLTMGKFVRWLGIYHQMLADPRSGGRRAYWSKDKGYDALNRSRYSMEDIMGIYEFEAIYSVFGIPPMDPHDPFDGVRGFVDAWNHTCKDALQPSWVLVIDESMIKWKGRGMPGWSFVPRKPEPCGMEGKTLACGECKCMIHFDMQEGKDRMTQKKFNKDYGKSVGCTLRLVEHYFNQGKVVIGDSWFGSPKAAVALIEKGLFCVMNVKGKRKSYPMERVQAEITKENRKFSLMSRVVMDEEEWFLVAGGHKEKKPMCLIATCSTMEAGEDSVYTIYSIGDDGNEETYTATYSTTKMHGMYRKYFNRIDLHNRDRQENFYFAQVLSTKSWRKRVIWELWGATMVNVHFTVQYFYQAHYGTMRPQQFKDSLALQLLYNPWLDAEAVARHVPSQRHKMLQMPHREHRPGATKNTKCRYCKMCTIMYCESCSNLRTGMYFGLCNSALRGCYEKHLRNEPLPANQPRGKTKKWTRESTYE